MNNSQWRWLSRHDQADPDYLTVTAPTSPPPLSTRICQLLSTWREAVRTGTTRHQPPSGSASTVPL